jgi:hypothetical protein
MVKGKQVAPMEPHIKPRVSPDKDDPKRVSPTKRARAGTLVPERRTNEDKPSKLLSSLMQFV